MKLRQKVQQTLRELRDMDGAKLREELKITRNELTKARFQHATAQLENTQLLPYTKKDIARIMTVLQEKDRVVGNE